MAERPANIVTAPNAVMAVRLVTGPVDHGCGVGIFECTIFSIRSMSMTGNAASRRRLSGFSSIAVEVSRPGSGAAQRGPPMRAKFDRHRSVCGERRAKPCVAAD
jgi:hypothetical protein